MYYYTRIQLANIKTFAWTLAQANLASKNNITNFVKKTDFDDKLKK